MPLFQDTGWKAALRTPPGSCNARCPGRWQDKRGQESRMMAMHLWVADPDGVCAPIMTSRQDEILPAQHERHIFAKTKAAHLRAKRRSLRRQA